MKVELITMELSYFKTHRQLEINFGNKTRIIGDNGTGKSTILDAWMWLWTGKNSHGDAQFNIKTIDTKTGKVIPKVEHSVKATFLINDVDILTAKKSWKEIWKTSSKTGEKVFTGHEAAYEMNGVGIETKKEFYSLLGELIPVDKFQLLSDVTYFNRQDTATKRKILMSIAGKITAEDIYKEFSEKEIEIIKAKTSRYNIDSAIKVQRQSIKETKENSEEIPVRISELSRMIVEPKVINNDLYEGLKEKRKALQNKLIETNSDTIESDKAIAINKAISEKEIEIVKMQGEMRRGIEEEINKYKKQLTEIESHNYELRRKRAIAIQIHEERIQKVKDTAEKIEAVKAKLNNLSEQWDLVSNQTIPDKDKVCPVCKTDLTKTDKWNEVLLNFAQNKKERLSELNSKGIALKKELKELENKLSQYQAIDDTDNIDNIEKEQDLKDVLEKIKQLQAQEISSNDITKKESEITALKKELEDLKSGETDAHNQVMSVKRGIKADIEIINERLKEIENDMRENVRIEELKIRIKDLKEQERRYGIELGKMGNTLFLLEKARDVKVQLIEDAVNSKFERIKFRMFKKQVNGEYAATCDTMLNNIPYEDLNTGGRIQAGLEIIKGMTKHYNLVIPVFIDNRESVSDAYIPEFEGQTVGLFKETGSKLIIKQ